MSDRAMTATQVRPDESTEQRQALMLMGYLRWQNATLTHASGDVTPLVTAAARVALSTAEGIGNGSDDEQFTHPPYNPEFFKGKVRRARGNGSHEDSGG